ncbi:MAG: TMEM175 family protein [Bacteroidota bacterium]|nr:TMEM175 family protein [Bacteroidota bacterium]
MPDKNTNEEIFLRTQFQIDRLTFFSDAVIAIAITLLVLEIKIPAIGKNVTWAELAKEYGDTIFQHLMALFICFVAVGSLWIHHHELFEFVNGFNKRLIKANLYFLFTVIILPLSISFNMEENNPQVLKVFVLIINIFLCYLFFYLMLYIIRHKKNSFYDINASEKILDLKKQTLLTTITLFLVSIMALISIKWFYLPFIIPFINRIIIRVRKYKIKKRLKKIQTHKTI